jgi:hypothetical protein
VPLPVAAPSHPAPFTRCNAARRNAARLNAGPLGVLGQNGLYTQEANLDEFADLAGWRGLGNPRVKALFNSSLIGFLDVRWLPPSSVCVWV